MRTLSLSLLLLGSAAVATAQPYSTRGFALGLGLQYAGVSASEGNFEADDSGGGIGLNAEYGFNETFSLFVNLDGSGIAEDTGLGHFDIGARIHLSPGQQVRPFVTAALSGVSVVNDEAETTFSGGGLTAGGGVRYFFSPRVALDLNGAFTFGQFTEVEVGNFSEDDLSIDMNSYRIRFGVLFNL